MRFKTSFDLRTICGETVLIATGAEHVDFGHLINLNETAADVYTAFSNRDFEASDVVDYLQAHYEGATREQMAADVVQLIDSFRQSGVLQ